MQVKITMQATIDTLQGWYPPLLPADEDIVNVSTWQPLWKMPGITTVHPENDKTDTVVEHIDSVLSNIHQVGIGYHDAVGDIAIPLIIAIFAFSFMFLFDAVNGINDKYKSPKISSLVENQASSKLIITISWASISYVLIYGMVTLFFQDSDFWKEWAICFDLAALIVSIVYACEVVSFAKCCMRFNKPSAVLELIDQGVKLKPRTLVALMFSLVGKLKNRRDPERKRLHGQGVRLLGGFVDLDKVIEHRVKEGSSIGFGKVAPTQAEKEQNASKLLKKLQPEDLLKFGLIPEFIGRIPIFATLDALTEDTLKMILTEPKNAVLKQYKCLLEMDGVDLEFEPEAIDLIAKKAIKRKTGARALKSIVEELMLDIMYKVPSDSSIKKFTITKDMIEMEEEKTETKSSIDEHELIQLPKKAAS